MAPGPRDRGFFVPAHPGLPDANGPRAATPPLRGSTRVSSAPPLRALAESRSSRHFMAPGPRDRGFFVPPHPVCPTRTGFSPRKKREKRPTHLAVRRPMLGRSCLRNERPETRT